ncbi:MAG: hypothetical protein ABIR62_04900 [Dokdonella sp.]|uniref:hypothetical protein n=1 Tax=Dokdonella sp. TaxID=2291710 RepID=UPI00326532CF
MKSCESGWIARAFHAATAACVAAALVAAWLWSPRVPYADAWRHYARLIDASFARGVLAADNGHPEVFANVVRWISLHQWHGNEDLQIVVGLLLALATLAALLRIIWTDEGLSPSQRAAAMFTITLGIFWLGNARALLHDNETLDVYSVLLCLALALGWTRTRPGDDASLRSTIGATILCFMAAFNFGSGIAAFGALFAVLFIARATWLRWGIVVAGLAVTLVVYRLLAGSVGSPPLAPIDQGLTAVRWLAAPLIYLCWPVVDPAVGGVLRVGMIARAWTAVFGDVRTSALPQAVCGTLLVIGVLRSTWRARRDRRWTGATHTLCLALAWFGLGVSALIALTRVDYFAGFPAQIYAPRYLPWSSLAWAGWLGAWVTQRRSTRWILGVVAGVGVLALSAEVGMTLVMRHQLEVANDTALAAVVGVDPGAAETGESDVEDVRVGAAAMKRLGAGPFAWSEAALMGFPPPANARRLAVGSWDMNRLRGTVEREWTLEAVIADPGCSTDRLLVLDRGRVAGLMRRVSGDRWRGVARVETADPLFEVGALACRH